ncbi:alpha/beta hydrolase [Flavobacterium subsaxonicum WB 4.1-42 = DSM 21790]|uniref:Alpha/beta hydrolase n=1 Tax=Flavobacterium subsaxonicum WB 4.1-42 = DSM 21790 TaxID=1121898 RepID=A0A0A2MSH2_9FLAO|nr:alpha/beta hydrolase [Flavobacterium subsaxonicum WB 4.1-42 = DSM 21790]
MEVEKNVKLHVTDVGDGKVVVLIPGWPFSDAMYDYQYQELVDKGYRVIGITMRGFGQSGKPYGKYNYDVFADDIKVVLDKLDIKDATLGGHSMGGGIVLNYVIRHNAAHVSKLAFFGGATPLFTQRPDYSFGPKKENIDGMISQLKADRTVLYEGLDKIFGASATSISPGIRKWFYDMSMEASPYAVTQCLIALRDTDLRSGLSKVTIPVLFLHGTKDNVVPFAIAENAQKSIKNSRLVRFENSGHELFVEERVKFNTELLKFIEE